MNGRKIKLRQWTIIRRWIWGHLLQQPSHTWRQDYRSILNKSPPLSSFLAPVLCMITKLLLDKGIRSQTTRYGCNNVAHYTAAGKSAGLGAAVLDAEGWHSQTQIKLIIDIYCLWAECIQQIFKPESWCVFVNFFVCLFLIINTCFCLFV